MKVLIAASEAYPFAKTGGLADVTGALKNALRGLGADARLIIPYYRTVRENFWRKTVFTGAEVRVPVGNRVFNARFHAYGVDTLFVQCDELFDRPELYGEKDADYKDNDFRYTFFSKAVLAAILTLDFVPDVIHCHDWQTGLIPLYVKTEYAKCFPNVATLMTIHNLGYHGNFPPSAISITGAGYEHFNPDGIEFYGEVSFLKAGIVYSTAINTVSENYAREILTREFGHGFDGILKKRLADLRGIVNGIDYEVWNPAADPNIPACYSAGDMSGKRECKKALAVECGFKDSGRPIVSMVSRLSDQKGIDLLLSSAERIIGDGVNMVVLGRGDEKYASAFKHLETTSHGHFRFSPKHDECSAHRIFAGSDITLMPSRYEPCGLTQMIAMRYGTIPVGRHTGGLVDTIMDYKPMSGEGSGFLFTDATPAALRECILRALCVYESQGRWAEMISAAMRRDFTWETSAKRYISLFKSIMRKGRRP